MADVLRSGDKIKNALGVAVELPYKNEHPCFGQQQEWQCRNLATWRLDGKHVMLHWCDDCKKRVEADFAGDTWYQLEERPKRVETEAEREERIYNDVFKPGESDAAYALRRRKELGLDNSQN